MAEFTEPRIHYIHADDGASIASWTLGDGPPLVYLAGGPWSHIELLPAPACRRWYERLSERRMVVRYDQRGTGLSGRDIGDVSLNAQVGDLEAVIDHCGLDRFALFGAADAGPVAIAYAARHPRRVSHLVLWCTWARVADLDMASLSAWRGLLDQDWQLTTETCAHLALGWSGGEIGRQTAERLREAVSPATMRASLSAMIAIDVTALLPRIQAPTLVLHRREISWLPVDAARQVASHIPNARLMVLPGEALAPYVGDATRAVRAIEEFLAERLEAVPIRDVQPDIQAPPIESIHLTGRELDVLRLIASGNTNAEIAAELSISVRTVERHIGNLYGKIDARGRADATAYALTRGLA